MRRLIINADDFGLSPQVNQGIIDAYKNGVVTSTTVLVNLPGFDASRQALIDCPQLPTGAHLNLSWGSPLSPPERVPSLVDRHGSFLGSPFRLGRRYWLGMLSQEEIEEEFRRQVQRFIDGGLTPTHLDSHQHIHCLRFVLSAMLKVASEFGIDKIRWPVERLPRMTMPEMGGNNAGQLWRNRLKGRIVCMLCGRSRQILDRTTVRTPDHFAGFGFMGRFNIENLSRWIERLPEGTTELMCHPGRQERTQMERSLNLSNRHQELETLLAPEIKERLRKYEIEQISFADL